MMLVDLDELEPLQGGEVTQTGVPTGRWAVFEIVLSRSPAPELLLNVFQTGGEFRDLKPFGSRALWGAAPASGNELEPEDQATGEPRSVALGVQSPFDHSLESLQGLPVGNQEMF